MREIMEKYFSSQPQEQGNFKQKKLSLCHNFNPYVFEPAMP